MAERRELQLANELQAIRDGVDAFNPDARLAVRSAFDAAEQVWKMVPEIIAALRAKAGPELSTATKEFNDLIGLTVPQAVIRAANRGIETIRVTSVNGQEQIGTCDYQESRLNVATENGKITAITGVG